MPNFAPLFKESKGQPIEYEGQMIHLMDRFPIGQEERLRIVRESTKPRRWRAPWKPRWRQAISLKTDHGIEVQGTRYDKTIDLWEDTAPPTVMITAFSSEGVLKVWNSWDTGSTDAWLNGAGIVIEELPNGRRYRCNDAYPDDDFADLVFRIERVDE